MSMYFQTHICDAGTVSFGNHCSRKDLLWKGGYTTEKHETPNSQKHFDLHVLCFVLDNTV